MNSTLALKVTNFFSRVKLGQVVLVVSLWLLVEGMEEMMEEEDFSRAMSIDWDTDDDDSVLVSFVHCYLKVIVFIHTIMCKTLSVMILHAKKISITL